MLDGLSAEYGMRSLLVSRIKITVCSTPSEGMKNAKELHVPLCADFGRRIEIPMSLRPAQKHVK